ncbi:MAG: M13 family metallopeptidase [Terriglobales bacterium]
MRNPVLCASSLLLTIVLCLAQSLAQSNPSPSSPATNGVPREIPAFDVNAIDKTVDPCVDFYQYACGTWMKNNPIPPDQSRWGRFNELFERNLYILRDILTEAQLPGKHSETEILVGTFYNSCMDESTIETKGTTPLAAALERINGIKTKADLIQVVAAMHRDSTPALFSFSSQPDMHDSMATIAYLDQGGITMPDRDYYIKDDPKSMEARQKYLEHVQKMLVLAGDTPDVATVEAKTVLAIETGLAQAAMDRTARRDPKTRDHKMTVAEIEAAAPNFDLTTYFADNGAPKFTSLNVGNPDFFKQVNEQINTAALADWKIYLRWKTINDDAPLLTRAFVEEDFNFNGKYLSGQKEMEPRWKRCVKATDENLGMALGKLYVDRTFGADGKERTLKMVRAIESAMREDIGQLTWMSDTTKKKAYEKLDAIVNNIGYPDTWRDYSSVVIKPGDYAGNSVRAAAFEVHREYKKIDQPTDRKDWGMTPPTVNAYYRWAMNDINFPAGILQPPFYGKLMDDAVNYGAIGVVIGHELTHGFDDQGRKFDAQGNLRDWWTADDGKEFEARVSCTANEYSNFVSVKDDKGEVKVNGRLTLGENTADNGGLKLAYMALKSIIDDTPIKPIDGYTPAQRYFLAYGQIWCQNVTDQEARKRVLTDPHSPGRWRVNGAVQNSAAFQQAFGCRAGQPMVAENACRVW